MTNPERKRIYVVDDDASVRDSLRFELGLEGWEVQTWDSGAAFLSSPDHARGDCIVLDYRMPGMDGLAVAEMLGARAVKTPVILITAPVSAQLRLRAARAGVTNVLEKPLLENALSCQVRAVIA